MKIKMSKALRNKLDAAKETDEFWMDSAKLDFALALEHERRRSGKSYNDVAVSMKTSPAYISKIFRGDANLTIESMVKLARTLGCNLDFKITAITKKDEIEWPAFKRQRALVNNTWKMPAFKPDDSTQMGRFPPEVKGLCSNDDLLENAA